MKFAELLLRIPDEQLVAREEEIDLGDTKSEIFQSVPYEIAVTHLFQRAATRLRIEAVNDCDRGQIHDGMDVEGARAHTGEHIWCGERNRSAAETPAYREVLSARVSINSGGTDCLPTIPNAFPFARTASGNISVGSAWIPQHFIPGRLTSILFIYSHTQGTLSQVAYVLKSQRSASMRSQSRTHSENEVVYKDK